MVSEGVVGAKSGSGDCKRHKCLSQSDHPYDRHPSSARSLSYAPCDVRTLRPVHPRRRWSVWRPWVLLPLFPGVPESTRFPHGSSVRRGDVRSETWVPDILCVRGSSSCKIGGSVKVLSFDSLVSLRTPTHIVVK